MNVVPVITFRILLVDDDLEDESAIRESLLAAGFGLILQRVTSEAEMMHALDIDTWNLVLIDEILANSTKEKIIHLLQDRLQEVPYLILYGSVAQVTALQLLQVAKMSHYITGETIAALGAAIVYEVAEAGKNMTVRLLAEQGVVMLMDAVSRALELRDIETKGHTRRVTELAMRLARRVRIHKAMLINIHRGSLAHDFGKLGIRDEILLKKGSLSDEEWKIMKTHPGLAYNLLSPITILKDAMGIPFCHHEHWDGTGYPRGLKGDDIPLEARIFSIVDVFDALTNDRPYRDAWTKGLALEYIKAESHTLFDPKVTPIFIDMMTEVE